MKIEDFDPAEHKGGDIRFQPGHGWSPDHAQVRPMGGDFIFLLPDGTEMFRIKADGTFLVRGDRVADDKKLYKAFSEWLGKATVSHGKKVLGVG